MEVIDNREESQFELHVDGLVAKLTYEIKGKKIYLFSTRVPESISGRGIGSRLVESSLELIEARKLKVIPYCSFIQSWFLKHPERRHLLAR